MCTHLGLARSSFYAWRTQVNQVSASAARREVLKVLIQEIYHEHRKTYGCRRITAELNDRGYPASVGLVAKLMRELGLAGIQPRAYRRTTIVGFRICWREISIPLPTPPGTRWLVILPTCAPGKGGCTWLP